MSYGSDQRQHRKPAAGMQRVAERIMEKNKDLCIQLFLSILFVRIF